MRSRPALLTPAFARILVMQSLFGISQACYALLPKFLALELDATPPQIGAVMAIYSAINIVLVPIVGVGVDRLGRRIFLLVGNAVCAVASLAFIYAESIELAILFRGLQGMGFACVFIGANALVADTAPAARLSHALALLTATMHGASASVPLLVEPVAERWGWEPVFIAAGACAALAVVLCLGVPNRSPASRGRGDGGPGIGTLLALPAAWRIIFVVTMVGVAVSALITFVQPFALERGIQRIAPFLFAYSAVAMAVRIFLGGFLDRIDRYRVALASVAGYSVLLFWVPQTSDLGLIGIGALLGIVHGAFFPTFNAMNLQGAGEAVRGKVVAVSNTGFNIGFAVGNFGLGFTAAAWGYDVLFMISGASVASALLLLALVRGSDNWSLGLAATQARTKTA